MLFALPLLVSGLLGACLTPGEPGADNECIVDRVVDGDTIRVSGCPEDRVRFLLIDTPEITNPVECYGEEAKRYVEERLPKGSRVRLEGGVLDKDQFGRSLRFVWLGDELLNETLVREGYGVRYRAAEETRFVDVIAAAESEARAARRGMWGAVCDGKR